MQFPDQKNVSYALVGKNLSVLADTTLVTGPETLSDGQIAILSKDNKSINSGTLVATDVIRFVQRSGNDLIYTPSFKVGDATVKLSGYTAPAEQVSFIGYNGSAGSLDVIDNNNYVAHITLTDYFSRQQVKFGAYKSIKTGATQVQIATGLVTNLIKNFKDMSGLSVKFDRTANGTIAALTGSATVYKLTKGSTTVNTYTVTADGTGTFTASTASVTAGDVISVPTSGGRSFSFTAVALGSGAGHTAVYIGTTLYLVADAGTNAQNATAIAAAINAGTLATAAVTSSTTVTITYNKDTVAPTPLVLSSDDDSTWANVAVTIVTGDSVAVKYVAAATTSAAATFELDIPYQGETGYFYEGSTVATNIGVTSSVTLWGIKVTGVTPPFKLDKYAYQKAYFDIALTGFTATTVTGKGVNSIGQAASAGVNTYEQIAELESFCKYNTGKALRGIYLTSDALAMDAVAGTKYEVATIQAKKITSSGVGIPMESPITIYLVFYKDSNQGDSIATILNGYYSSGAFAA